VIITRVLHFKQKVKRKLVDKRETKTLCPLQGSFNTMENDIDLKIHKARARPNIMVATFTKLIEFDTIYTDSR
jgi:hypothetical protein